MNLLATIIALGALGIAAATATQIEPTASPIPAPEDAEQVFFDALQRRPQRRGEALRLLTHAACRPSPRPKDVLLLGMTHLWIVADGTPPAERGAMDELAHAVLASHWLRRAETLAPDDDRIPGWRSSAEWAVARLERRDADANAAVDALARLAADDPCFHSVPLAIAAFDRARDSGDFQRALRAMNAAFGCSDEKPSAQDRARWPHNVHGFLVALADVRLKAGDVGGAETALVIAEARAGFDAWAFRGEAEARLASLRSRAERYANDDRRDDPPFFLGRGSASCSACHRASNG